MQDVMAIYRSRYLLSVEAEAVKDGLVLAGICSDYLVLVSTDLTLSEEEIIQTYGKRWSIEVFSGQRDEIHLLRRPDR